MQKNLQDLKKRIKHKIPHLTESQKIVANYIVENPQKFALSSVRELETELKTSKSTIVRLAQALNYNGFHELRSAFLERIRHDLDPVNRYKTFLSEPIDESAYLDLIANETINNIHDTLRLIDREHFKKAINLIEHANHVFTMGLGISKYLAEIAAYILNRVSIKSNYLTFGGLNFTEQIINMSQDDVICVFAFPPYSEETIEAARYAKEKNIKVIVITDKVTNKIVPYSDLLLQVVVESMTISNSIMAVLVLLYAIIAQIGHEFKNRILQRLESIEHVRDNHAGKS